MQFAKLNFYDLAAGSVCFMLLRNTEEASDWSKSFEACSTLITAVINIFKQTKIQMDVVSRIFHIVEKMWFFFLNKGTFFTLASPV